MRTVVPGHTVTPGRYYVTLHCCVSSTHGGHGACRPHVSLLLGVDQRSGGSLLTFSDVRLRTLSTMARWTDNIWDLTVCCRVWR
jgi:hypothetical protein